MKRKIELISFFMVLGLLLSIPKSYGAIASKPTTVTNGSNVLTNRTISEAFLDCKGMTNVGESLYGSGSNVKPHLVTNKEWGAVSYLSNSIYGTNTAGQNTGVTIQINGVNYRSTTGNASGIMNWGSNPYKDLRTQTSAISSDYINATTKPTEAQTNLVELESALQTNPEYVDVIEVVNYAIGNGTEGMALKETDNFWNTTRAARHDITKPIAVRHGLFGYSVGANGWGNNMYSGTEKCSVFTFRPTIWN